MAGKDESRSYLSGPQKRGAHCTGWVDGREKTRLPALRIEGYEGFEGTQRLGAKGKVQSC